MTLVIIAHIRDLTIIPSPQGGQVTDILVTEDGLTQYRLQVAPCARLTYYYKDDYKHLLIEGDTVYAASASSYSGLADNKLWFDKHRNPPNWLHDKIIEMGYPTV